MTILCTHPGRHGDVLWALPTIRAISETYGTPVDLVLSGRYGSLVPLIQRQAYIRAVHVEPDWQIVETAPITPRIPTIVHGLVGDQIHAEYDRVFHLGYDGWPSPDLARDIYNRANGFNTLDSLDLDRPWITPSYTLPPQDLAIGFTDEWFELKYGLYWLLRNRFELTQRIVSVSSSPRWQTEGELPGWEWEIAAAWIAASRVFVGCCSALHVLAVALGKPVVCVEPAPQRHQEIFYPLGTVGKVRLVLGGDGRQTFDARHLIAAVEESLARRTGCEGEDAI